MAREPNHNKKPPLSDTQTVSQPSRTEHKTLQDSYPKCYSTAAKTIEVTDYYLEQRK